MKCIGLVSIVWYFAVVLAPVYIVPNLFDLGPVVDLFDDFFCVSFSCCFVFALCSFEVRVGTRPHPCEDGRVNIQHPASRYQLSLRIVTGGGHVTKEAGPEASGCRG